MASKTMWRLIRNAVTIATAMAFMAPQMVAQVVTSRGSATMPYGPPICGTAQGVDRKGEPIKECQAPTPLDFQEVTRRAAVSAIERYVAEGGEDQLRAFERIRDSVRTRFDDIVVSATELNRAVDPATRQLTVAVRVEINEARLRNLLRATSNVVVAGGPKSMMGMFLLAREQASVETFGPERRTSIATERRDTTSTSNASTRDSTLKVRESEAIKGGAVTISGAAASTEASTTAQGASTAATASSVEASSAIQRAARVQYAVAPAQDLDAVIGGRLASAGYETVEAAFLEDDQSPGLVDAVRADFGSGDDLKAATLRRVAAAAAQQEVKFALIGTVDMSLPSVDEVTGLSRVYAKVQAKVYDVSARLPRTLVNVGPAQYAGIGPTPEVAKTNALKIAAEEIARAVIDQLSNRDAR